MNEILIKDLKYVSQFYDVLLDDFNRFVVITDFRLPPGYNFELSAVLITIPNDYPISPLGIGKNRVYLPISLRYQGRELADFHPNSSPPFTAPGCRAWGWWCYEQVKWNPKLDSFHEFLEMLRADLTNPRTR